MLRLGVAVAAAALIVPLTAVEASAAPPIRFARVQYDSPGTDTDTNVSRNAEWIRVKNYGNRRRDLTGWKIRDRGGNQYRFPKFVLRPGKSVKVHTGRGRNTATDLYWRKDNFIWNNSGDKAILKKRGGERVDVCKWGDGPGAKDC